MYDIFISHNRLQKPWVREFVKILRNGGFKVFFDEDTVAPGENIIDAIQNGILKSNWVILIITPSSTQSKWVAMEIAMSIYDDPNSSKNKLIPLVLEQTDSISISPWINVLHKIDLTDNKNRNERFKYLLEYLKYPIKPLPSPPVWSQTQLGINSSVQSLQVADIDDIIKWGWDGVRLLDELIKLDYKTMDGLTEVHEGQISQWAPVFMDHPDTWRLIINAPENIIGYWHYVPLFGQEYTLAMNGKLMDSEITTDKVKIFELPGWYNIYFVSICILSQYRRTPAIRLLFDSLISVVTNLASEGVMIKEILANAYTDSGKSLCKSLDMKFLKKHEDHGEIFFAEFNDLLNSSIFQQYESLKKLYLSKSKIGSKLR
jgi:hypothetical protein